MIARPAPLALPAALAPRLDEKYGRRPDPPDDGDAASCDGDGDAASSDGDASSDGGGAFDGDGAPSLRVPLCADGRTAAVALPAEPPPAATHVARGADVAAPRGAARRGARLLGRAADPGRQRARRAPCTSAACSSGACATRVGELLRRRASTPRSRARPRRGVVAARPPPRGRRRLPRWQRRLGDDVAPRATRGREGRARGREGRGGGVRRERRAATFFPPGGCTEAQGMLRAQLQERPLAVLSRREAPYDGRAILLIRTGYNRYEFRIDGGPSHVCTLEHLDDAAARARAPRPPDEVRDDALRQDALAHMGARRARADAARPPAAAAAAPAVAAAADPPAPGSPDLSRSSPVAPAPETPYVLRGH